jgi:hypothetical protein
MSGFQARQQVGSLILVPNDRDDLMLVLDSEFCELPRDFPTSAKDEKLHAVKIAWSYVEYSAFVNLESLIYCSALCLWVCD